MTETIGWAMAAAAAALVALARVLGKGKKRPTLPAEPPEQVAADHARDAIQNAAQSKMDEIDDALKGDDPTASLARLANLANKRRL